MGWESIEYDGYSDGKYKWVMVGSEELLKNPLYKNYTLMDKPLKFSELFRSQNFEVVELRSIIKLDSESMDKCGRFCGSFGWIDNKLKSLDGDSYNSDMIVYGYMSFENPEACIIKGLSILVGSDW